MSGISRPPSITPRAVAAKQQAALAGLEAKYLMQQAMISQAEADLTAKAARATFAGADAVRYRDLALTTFGTRQNAERASADLRLQHGQPLPDGGEPRLG